MDNRLHNLNKKISKSTIEMQRLISQIILPQKPQQLAPRHRHSMRQTQLQPLNPEQPQSYQNKRQINEMYGMKNSNIETNSLTKFQESKDRFYSSQKYTTSNQNQGWKTNYSHKLQKSRDQVGKDTKFAIGNKLYPANNHIKQEISRVRNTSRVIANKQQTYKSPSSRKLAQLDHNSVLQYAMTRPPLTQSSKPQQIFDYFYEFAPYFCKPLIKKFKNCFYFGESLDSSANSKYKSKYNGFLYFFNMKIYYGGFQDQYKHGYGVQINLKSGITYKGNFIKGHKVGKFLVFSENMLYEGYLEKGKYHGNGRLQTPISIYVGEFSNGMRNGEGQQYFFKSGLKLKGVFEMDKFCNNSQQQIASPSSNRKNSRNQDAYKLTLKQKKFPKINNIFEFSFHDSSEEEPDLNPRKSQIKWTLKKIQPTRNLLKRKQYQQSCDMQQASEDDPLPAPFRRMAYSK